MAYQKFESQEAKVSVMSIAKEKVLGKLKGPKMDKSPKLDGLHPSVLKEIPENIVEILVVIFQESLESATIPEDWKVANVTPLLKKRVRQNSELSAGQPDLGH
eukprot:g38677.t1